MPDRIYVFQDGRYGAVGYDDLTVTPSSIHFAEMGSPPPDAQVVGWAWIHPKKDGSPDGRYRTNWQVPICNYGVLTLQSTGGLALVLHLSRVETTFPIASALGYRVVQDDSPAEFRSEDKTDPEAFKWEKATAPDLDDEIPIDLDTEASPPSWIEVLGVREDCSKEEATAAYRSLAKAYHPDLVAHLAPEFRVLAGERMKEINVAFGELKSLRGW